MGKREGLLGLLTFDITRKEACSFHDRFIGKFGLPFTLLSDPDAAMMRDYGAFGEKTMYGKKVQGTIRSTFIIGPDGAVLRHWTVVKKAETHPQEVTALLKGE